MIVKPKVIVVCIVLVFGVALSTWRVLNVVSCLEGREKEIKDALRAANNETSASNIKDGVERFIRTGELILEPTYLLKPKAMRQQQSFRMRVYPRVTKDRADGWVGLRNGSWYVKIY